jgi:hypothetical protein
MWCAFGNLSRDLWAGPVLSLLDLRSLNRLDSAISSKAGRAEFVKMLEQQDVQVHDGGVKGNVKDFIRWISLRRLRVRTITITRDHPLVLAEIEDMQPIVDEILLSYSAAVEGMNNELAFISPHILSRVDSLYFGPITLRDIDTAHVDKDKIIAQSVSYLPQLARLVINMNTQLGRNLCWALQNRGGQLRELNVQTYAVQDADAVLCSVAAGCPKLQSITFLFSLTNKAVTLAGLLSLSHGCPLLEVVSINPPYDALISSAAPFLETSSNLTSVNCSTLILDCAALSTWIAKKTNLKSVGLAWDLYQQDVSEHAAEVLGRVKDLTADRVGAMGAIRGLQEALRYTTQLETVKINLEQSMGLHLPLPLSIVTQLATSCTRLVSVWLSNTEGLDGGEATDEAFALLAAQNRNLQEMFVLRCNHIGDQTRHSTGAHPPPVRSLYICPALRVTDAGLLALARGCPKLSKISTGASRVTDAGLRAVAECGTPTWRPCVFAAGTAFALTRRSCCMNTARNCGGPTRGLANRYICSGK